VILTFTSLNYLLHDSVGDLISILAGLRLRLWLTLQLGCGCVFLLQAHSLPLPRQEGKPENHQKNSN